MAIEEYSRLNTSERVGVTTVTLNRPEVRNAFDEILIAELTDCVARAEERRSRALVLRGAGPSFCAGADLNWMARAANYTYEENLEDARALQRLFAALSHFRGVTIAAVHGAAIGGGAGLVAVCDIAIAEAGATFALSEVRLGLIPAVIGPYVLQKVGLGAARSLFVTGERFDADKALRIGLVHQVAQSSEQLAQLVDVALGRILEAGPEAIATAKQLLRDIAGRSPDEVAERTASCIANLRVSAEGQEGIHAFLEKRKPSFAVFDDPKQTSK